MSQPLVPEYGHRVASQSASEQDEVSAAEIVAALSLATDLGMGFPLEHGLQSTLVAMRLVDALGVDSETALQTYYGCLLIYLGCTADAEIAAGLFDDGALLEHFTPVMFGSPAEPCWVSPAASVALTVPSRAGFFAASADFRARSAGTVPTLWRCVRSARS